MPKTLKYWQWKAMSKETKLWYKKHGFILQPDPLDQLPQTVSDEQSKQKEEDKETFAATAESVTEVKSESLASQLLTTLQNNLKSQAAGLQNGFEAQTAAGLEAQTAAGASYWGSNWKKHVTGWEALPIPNQKPFNPKINPNVWAEAWEYKKKKTESSPAAINLGETKKEIEQFIKDRTTWSLVDIVYEFAFNMAKTYLKEITSYQLKNNKLQEKVAELEAKLKDSVPKVKTNPVADGRRKFKDE